MDSAPGPPSGLPRVPTAFVGRIRELDEVRESLQSCRLLTLVGVAGCGKTRLAIEAAHTEAHRFADGVAIVDLAPLSDPARLLQTLASATGSFESAADSRGSATLERRVHHILAERELLVVVDNCEHVLREASLVVSRLLDHCPRVSVIATSRQALGVQGEHRLVVGPMAEDDAVELFRHRAEAAGARLDVEHEPTIRAICDRLDGIALAVELAAARCRMMSPQDIARRLDNVLPLLSAPEHDRVARHRAMLGTLDWSHGLLNAEEQAVFRRLAVFRGGWTLDAAEAVCAGDGLDVVDALTGLVDKSLVVVDPSTARYRFLEPVRQYAWSRLQASGEIQHVMAQHGAFCRRFAAAIDKAIPSSGLTEAHRLELHNFRAALENALNARDGVMALRLFVRLSWYWTMVGAWREGIDWGVRGLDSGQDIDPRLELVARCMVSAYLAHSGRPRETAPHVGRVIELLEHGPSDAGARYLLSNALECRGESPVALLEDAERVAARSGDRPFAAYAARALARHYVLHWRLDHANETLARARSHVGVLDVGFGWNLKFQQASLDVLRGRDAAGDVLDLAESDTDVPTLPPGEERGMLLALAGDPVRAAEFLGREVHASAQGGWMQRVVVQLALAALARARLGQADVALVLRAAAEAVRRQIGYPSWKFVTEVGTGVFDEAARALGHRGTESAVTRGEALDIDGAVGLARSPVPSARPGPLSSREAQVLALVAAGFDNSAIAADLYISRRTVDAHLNHIRDKLGLSTRTSLARWAMEHGLGSTATVRSTG